MECFSLDIHSNSCYLRLPKAAIRPPNHTYVHLCGVDAVEGWRATAIHVMCVLLIILGGGLLTNSSRRDTAHGAQGATCREPDDGSICGSTRPSDSANMLDLI